MPLHTRRGLEVRIHCRYSRREVHAVGESKFATAAEIHSGFDEQAELLHWLAEVITGDAQLARECVIDARDLSSKNSAVFRDWLVKWAKTATVRRAIELARPNLSVDSVHAQTGCTHHHHEPLSEEQIVELLRIPAKDLIAGLDGISRAVLILRGVQHAAVQDCVLTLGVTRGTVTGALCNAYQWLDQTHRGSASPRVGDAGMQVGAGVEHPTLTSPELGKG